VQAVRRYIEKIKRARGVAAKTKESETHTNRIHVLTLGRGFGLGLGLGLGLLLPLVCPGCAAVHGEEQTSAGRGGENEGIGEL